MKFAAAVIGENLNIMRILGGKIALPVRRFSLNSENLAPNFILINITLVRRKYNEQ